MITKKEIELLQFFKECIIMDSILTVILIAIIIYFDLQSGAIGFLPVIALTTIGHYVDFKRKIYDK